MPSLLAGQVGAFSFPWQPHPLSITLQRPTTHKAAQHHSLPAPIIDADLDKEAAALIGTVVQVNGALVVSALGQIGAVAQHPVELHHGREQAEGVEAHSAK
jgi:hypothetical protein